MFKSLKPKRLPLSGFERRMTAKNGLLEEGVIEFLFSKIPTTALACVEIGAGDGANFSLTNRLLVEHGWSGIVIEASPSLSQKLQQLHQNNPRIAVVPEPLEPDQVEKVFKKCGLPAEFDLLCIDIDGMDFHIWEQITSFRPSVVMIEYNPSFPPPQEFVVPYQRDFGWGGDDYYGASFESLLKLAEKKGYGLAHVMSHGDNLIFVKRELLKFLPPLSTEPRDYYQIAQYGRYGRCANGKGHPASARHTSALARVGYQLRYYLMKPFRELAAGRR